MSEKFAKSVNWERVSRDDKVLRFSSWYTSGNCKCLYKYGNFDSHPNGFKPHQAEEWLTQLAQRVKDVYNLEHVPNAFNFNRYDEAKHSLSYHSDNEHLFKGKDGTADIVSLSVGESRMFNVKKKYKPVSTAIDIPLHSGDLLGMFGMCQVHYQHQVAEGVSAGKTPRYNCTMRYICNHDKGCKRNS